MKIGLIESNILKGIAIVGMMMLHFWGNPEWISPALMYEGILPNSVYIGIGKFGNVCVSIFAILTGYSFAVREDKWKNKTYRGRKFVEFLLSYWLYVFIFCVVGALLGSTMPSIGRFCFNLVGLQVGVGKYVCVPFAWYVSFYLSTILLYPVIIKIWGGQDFKIDIIALFFTLGLVEILDINISSQNALGYFFDHEKVLITLIIGYLLAKYGVIEKIGTYKSEHLGKFIAINIIILVFILFLRIRNFDLLVDWWGIIYTGYIILFVVVCQIFHRISFIEKGVRTLGKYSMGMWYISGIFFLDERLLTVAYFLHNPTLVLIWVLGITFVVSFVITEFMNKIFEYISLKQIEGKDI